MAWQTRGDGTQPVDERGELRAVTDPPEDDGAVRAGRTGDLSATAFAGPTADADSQAAARTWRVALRDALFVPAPRPGRHRPVDAVVAAVGVVLLGFTTSRSKSSTSLELTFAELVNGLPDDLVGVAGFLYRLGALWFVSLVAPTTKRTVRRATTRRTRPTGRLSCRWSTCFRPWF